MKLQIVMEKIWEILLLSIQGKDIVVKQFWIESLIV